MTGIELDKLLNKLKARKGAFPELCATPWLPTSDCIPLPLIEEGLRLKNFSFTQHDHLRGCAWCKRAQVNLTPKTPVCVPADEYKRWVVDSERKVVEAARQQGYRLNLPTDPDRDQDAYTHSYLKVTDKLAGDSSAFETEAHCTHWMMRTARNWVCDQARRSRARTKYEHGYERAESHVDHTVLLVQMHTVIPLLSEELREPVALLLRGMKWEQIAEELDIPMGTAYSRYKRALHDLRRKLAEIGVSEEDLLQPLETLIEAIE